MHTYINKWRPIEIAVLLALAVTLLVGAASLHRQDGLQEKMIRLHVIANSDSEDDQTMKLLARDAVLTRRGNPASGIEQGGGDGGSKRGTAGAGEDGL